MFRSPEKMHLHWFISSTCTVHLITVCCVTKLQHKRFANKCNTPPPLCAQQSWYILYRGTYWIKTIRANSNAVNPSKLMLSHPQTLQKNRVFSYFTRQNYCLFSEVNNQHNTMQVNKMHAVLTIKNGEWRQLNVRFTDNDVWLFVLDGVLQRFKWVFFQQNCH